MSIDYSKIVTVLNEKFEKVSNKVTSITSESTDDQYPTAKAVYEAIGGGTGTTDYESLNNKPKINSVELTGDKTSADLGLADKEHSHDDKYYTQDEVNDIVSNIKGEYTQGLIDDIAKAIEDID